MIAAAVPRRPRQRSVPVPGVSTRIGPRGQDGMPYRARKLDRQPRAAGPAAVSAGFEGVPDPPLRTFAVGRRAGKTSVGGGRLRPADTAVASPRTLTGTRKGYSIQMFLVGNSDHSRRSPTAADRGSQHTELRRASRTAPPTGGRHGIQLTHSAQPRFLAGRHACDP